MGTSVFLSSTCWDLVDLRAELFQELRQMGLDPVMSDIAISGFHVERDRNAVETCLANVRVCDVYAIVLSGRYGESLEKIGYPDLSTTHLEYREAREHGKPIYMYVRDRLEADYAIWKRNPQEGLKLGWVSQGDFGILQLLDEHRELVQSASNTNWVATFKDSVELKKLLRRDFQAISGEAIVRQLIEEGRMAFVMATVKNWHLNAPTKELLIGLEIENAGTAPALDTYVTLDYPGHEDTHTIRSLLPGATATVSFDVRLTDEDWERKWTEELYVSCMYTCPEGHLIEDQHELSFGWSDSPRKTGFARFSGKQYIRSGALRVSVRDNESPPFPGSDLVL